MRPRVRGLILRMGPKSAISGTFQEFLQSICGWFAILHPPHSSISRRGGESPILEVGLLVQVSPCKRALIISPRSSRPHHGGCLDHMSSTSSGNSCLNVPECMLTGVMHPCEPLPLSPAPLSCIPSLSHSSLLSGQSHIVTSAATNNSCQSGPDPAKLHLQP